LRFIVVVILSLFTCFKLYAGVYPVSGGVKSFALANSVIASTGHWALMGNPALMSTSEYSSIGIFNNARFGVSDLNTTGFASCFKTNQGHFGLSFTHYGIEEFNRQSITVGFGREFSKSHVGASASYLNTKMSKTEKVEAMFINLGLAYNFSKKFLLAFSSVNINRAKVLVQSSERLESIYNLGSKISISKEVTLYSEVQYELDLERTVGKLGLEFEWSKALSLLSGIATSGEVFNFGGIYTKEKLQAGMAFSYHQYLGVSPSISISYRL